MRKLFTFLGAIPVLFLALASCKSATVGDSHYATIKIYHTNDVHAHFLPDGQGRGGFAYLSSVLRVIKEQEASALILDAGDYYKKGSMPAQLSHDSVTADLLNLMPYYDARAVGNNEVKVGITQLIEWAKKKEHAPLLSANFVEKDNHPVFAPSYVFKRNGVTIGVIGITPLVPVEKDVQADPSRDKQAPYKILPPEETVPALIKKMRPQVDVLILLSHQSYKTNLKWAKDHPEVDLIVSGHSHVLTPDQKKMGGNAVVEAGEFGHQLGVVNLVFDRTLHRVSSLESTFWPIGVDMQLPDKAVGAAVESAYKKWAPDAFQKLAQVTGDLTLIRTGNEYEGSLPDWAADLFCARTNCDLALVNREMFREDVKKGEVTRETVFLAAPYDDKIATVVIPREKLLTALKESVVDDFKKTGYFAFGLSKAKVKVTVGGEPKEIKTISIEPASAKARLKVVLPLYVVNHCTDFFRATFCPLTPAETNGDVRKTLEEGFLTGKKISPPSSGRVNVIGEAKLPESVQE